MFADAMLVFWRDWKVLERRLVKFLLSRMITPLLYLIAFGWGIGRTVTVTGGGSYLDFLVPGIIALNSMNISFSSVGPPVHTERLFHKTLDEYLTAPISELSFIFGKVMTGILRGMLSSAIIVIISYLFGARFTINAWFLFILLLNCTIFSLLGFTAALVIDGHEDLANFNTYILLPMSFLCGTFFRTAHLPEAVRYIIDILPLTNVSVLLRSIGAGAPINYLCVGNLVFYLIIMFIAARWSMKQLTK